MGGSGEREAEDYNISGNKCPTDDGSRLGIGTRTRSICRYGGFPEWIRNARTPNPLIARIKSICDSCLFCSIQFFSFSIDYSYGLVNIFCSLGNKLGVGMTYDFTHYDFYDLKLSFMPGFFCFYRVYNDNYWIYGEKKYAHQEGGTYAWSSPWAVHRKNLFFQISLFQFSFFVNNIRVCIKYMPILGFKKFDRLKLYVNILPFHIGFDIKSKKEDLRLGICLPHALYFGRWERVRKTFNRKSWYQSDSENDN